MTIGDQLLSAAFGPLIDLVLAVSAVALGFIAKWAAHKAQNAKQTVALQAIMTLSQAADNIVTQIETTLRSNTQGAGPGGQLTADQGAALKAIAVSAVKQQADTLLHDVLGPAGLTGASVTAAIDHLVESATARLASNTRTASQQAALLQRMAGASAPKPVPV